ncbi:hypothetical protein [Chitinophaga qingshengii]|uniref:Uncharacterized protein n=1 Tax=Chitinophaga qingshengii TaxID=1569794 RepID=A0ABR7TTG7_9BACT|nr:hypothetical protein [Chitinophaga qingshengii]MBC9933318.1 hypothetical protein [Chitinophaga qingshengii]
MEAFKQFALNSRVANFQHGTFKKKENIYILGKRYEATVFYKQYQPVNVVIYEVDKTGAKTSASFSSLTYSLWMDIRKAYILNRE